MKVAIFSLIIFLVSILIVGIAWLYRSIGQYNPLFSVENNTKITSPLEIKRQTLTNAEILQISGVVKQAPVLIGDQYYFTLESKFNQRTIKMQIYLGDHQLFNRVGLSQVPSRLIQPFSKWEGTDIAKVASLIKKDDQVVVYLPLKASPTSECTEPCQSRKAKLEEYMPVNQKFFDNLPSFTSSFVTAKVGPVSQIIVGSD